MKCKFLPVFFLLFTLGSCSKTEFTKKHEGHWKANGVSKTCTENTVFASYDPNDNTKLDVTAYASTDQSDALYMRLDLTKINQNVVVVRPNTNYNYAGSTSSNFYPIVSGHYEITSYSEGNPASRHVEAAFTFHFQKTNNPADTINITDGYVYLNNY